MRQRKDRGTASDESAPQHSNPTLTSAHSIDGAATIDDPGASPHQPDEIRGTVLLRTTYELEGASAYFLDDMTALDVAALSERLLKSQRALRDHRSALARAANVRPSSLPLACAVDGRTITLAILAPPAMDPPEIVERLLPVAREIEDAWFRNSERAREEAALAAVRADETNRANAPGPDPQATQNAPHPINAPKADKHIREALLDRQLPGPITVTVSAGGEPPRHPAVTVPAAPPTPPPRITLGEPRTIDCEVARRTAIDRCALKEVDGKRLQEASFSTSGSLPMLVNLLAGFPPVKLEVQDYVSDQADSPPPHPLHILRLVGLTSEWDQDVSIVEHMRSCVDLIAALHEEVVAARSVARRKGRR